MLILKGMKKLHWTKESSPKYHSDVFFVLVFIPRSAMFLQQKKQAFGNELLGEERHRLRK